MYKFVVHKTSSSRCECGRVQAHALTILFVVIVLILISIISQFILFCAHFHFEFTVFGCRVFIVSLSLIVVFSGIVKYSRIYAAALSLTFYRQTFI